jgi:hypothetical protein
MVLAGLALLLMAAAALVVLVATGKDDATAEVTAETEIRAALDPAADERAGVESPAEPLVACVR